MPDVETLIADTSRLSDAAVVRLQGRMKEFEAQVLARLQAFMQRFDTTDGRFVPGAKATALLLEIKKEMEGVLEMRALDAASREFLTNFDDVAANVRAVHGEENGITVPKSLVNDAKGYAVEATLYALKNANIHPKFIEPVRKALFNHINFGGGVAEAEGVLRKIVLGEPDKLNGAISQWIGQVATDAINQYEGTVQASIAQHHGLTAVRYVNSIIETSRPQCVRWVGMEWITEAQLPEEIRWAFENGSGMVPETDATTFLVYRGGFRCRHKGIPVRDDAAQRAQGAAAGKPKPTPKKPPQEKPPAPKPAPPPEPPKPTPAEVAAQEAELAARARIDAALRKLEALPVADPKEPGTVEPPIKFVEKVPPQVDKFLSMAADDWIALNDRGLVGVRDVALAGVVSNQGIVFKPTVEAYVKSGSVVSASNPGRGDLSLPLVIEYKGITYVVDGNHRTSAQILLEQTNAPMRVLVLDAKGVPIPPANSKPLEPKKKRAPVSPEKKAIAAIRKAWDAQDVGGDEGLEVALMLDARLSADYTKRVHPELTKAEWHTLTDYIGDGYADFNDHLRGVRSIPEVQEDIAIVRGALNRLRTTEPIVAFRRLENDYSEAFVKQATAAGVGAEITMNGFSSTSVALAIGKGKVTLRLFVPKGSKAIYLEPITTVSGELELLLDHETRARILAIQTVNGRTFVDLLVLP